MAWKQGNAPAVHIPLHMQAVRQGTARIVGDNEINDLEQVETKIAKIESWVARQIAATLESNYPNRGWRITCDIGDGGIVVIQCPGIAPELGYVMHMERKTIHDMQEQAKRAGGEIMERFGIKRDKKFDVTQYTDFDRDARGNAKVGVDGRAESIDGSGRVLKEGEK